MGQHDPYNAFLYHLGQSEEYKRMKEANAHDARSYYAYGARESEEKARAYDYRAMLGSQFQTPAVTEPVHVHYNR
ncbi:hypothetical protein [Bacillus sp. V5-8f]|uniref:hypothetical protein n=1 Tax=Bacillus sp. V5-8f TaxID=2053044 RepID=UPI000C76C452|nr:hypothetical protein [Bacillus sp. V5-8f]PLT32747.1 hypothetical protein CUU64_17735 [Bacillus sp. V5-8f]